MITNDRIRILAERALALAKNDATRAVRIMSELSGLSFEAAFEAIEEAAAISPKQEANHE
jgi:hypothetical protein